VRERDFQKQVEQAAALLGWLCFHFPAMQMNPSGWPDLICFRDGRTKILELKNEKGKLGPRQEETLAELQLAGMDARVYRPDDWDELEQSLREDA
jgi:hypothetical protein